MQLVTLDFIVIARHGLGRYEDFSTTAFSNIRADYDHLPTNDPISQQAIDYWLITIDYGLWTIDY
jgi:hypothetical protein